MENPSERNTPVQAYTKLQLRTKYNVSRETLNKWLKSIEHLLPHYTSTAKVLTPAQVAIVFNELGSPNEVLEERKVIVKKR